MVYELTDWTAKYAEEYPVGDFSVISTQTLQYDEYGEEGAFLGTHAHSSEQHQKDFDAMDGQIIEWLYGLIGSEDLVKGVCFCPATLMHCFDEVPKYPVTIVETEKGVYTAHTSFVKIK